MTLAIPGLKIKLETIKTRVRAVATVNGQWIGDVEARRTGTNLRSLNAEGAGLHADEWRGRDVFIIYSAVIIRDYQGKGLGTALYRAVIEGVWDAHRAVTFSHSCANHGDTSREAQRVWASLARIYRVVSVGDCHGVLGAVPR